ncbi:dockerin type I domain-containing protein, partial [Ruminococcus sp.]|uniref:dockerin type I domain-containing protein n=1 Tax=Ruminococcus sp. TaxID=41978 RepID=UPI002E807AA6
WDPAASANHMTILSAGLYEIEYTLGDYDTSDPEFKFAINDAWTHNFGLADGGVIANGVETDAIYNGSTNIKITGLTSGTTIKMYLDLTEFNFETKTGAKMTITWTEPATEAPTEAPTEPPVVPIVYNLNDETANILWEDRCSTDSYWDIYVETDGINFLLGALSSTQAAGTYTWADLDNTACEIFVGEALTPYHFTDGSCTVTNENNTVTVSGIFTCEDGNTYDLTFSTGRIYSVTWMNGDEILKIDANLAVGDTPSFIGETPVKPEDDDFTYEFMGWSDENGVYNPDALPPVSGDATYVAEFKSTPKYTAGYYIIGTMTDWKINDAYMLTPNDNNIDFTEYMFEDFSINMGDMFKVVYAEAGKDKIWYPTGMGNNYGENGEFTTGGYYTVYFRPNSDGGEDWFYNCIYVVCTMTDAAMLVNGQINVLPEAEDVTLNDKAAVEAARADYDALSDADKAFVDPALLQKLTDVEAAIADLEAAKTVENQINALPDVIIYDDKADVEAARQAYDALTDAQKALVDPAALQKLTDAEQNIAVREPAKAVEALIFALPDTITLADKADVEAARAALDALTPEQEYVTFIALDKLFRAEAAIADLEAAKTVENQINALPDVIIYDDKADVEAARQAYDALTDAQKALVDPVALQKLTDAEQSIAVREPAKAVEALIFALPDTITLADKADVEAARAALDALTPEQAEYVTFIALDKLFRAEDAIAAAEVTAMIDALPAADDVTVNDETDIINARAAYDALSDAQKVLIDADTLQKLTDDEAAINSFVLLGDADGDGDISILDATFIQRYLADFDLTVPFNENAADVDGDDDISILDAAFIQRFLVDMDVDYPINQYVKR